MQTDRTAAGDGDDRSRAVIAHSPAQFAVRTLRALEVLAFTPTTAPRLAAELGVHQRTTRRLLRQLRQDGWVSYTREPPHIYAPTLRSVALAAHIGGRAPLATLTAAAVEQLHAATGLPATLAIPAYDATVCLVRSCGDLAAGPLLTLPEPAHCTAAGKVLMAHREPWCRSILALPLVGCTERTVTDPRLLEQEFERIRVAGYAVADGEHVDGVCEVAAPVVGPDGDVLAAIAAAVDGGAEPGLVPDGVAAPVQAAAREATEALVTGAGHCPLHRGIVYRLLASYGLAPVNAYL
jgi:DNA-binding IclR family transcriptional regulator